MKHGKKPSVRQGIFLEENGFAPHEWLVVKDTTTEMWIVSKSNSDHVITVEKEGR